MRRSKNRARRPRVYRIPVELYLIALGAAFALSIAISLLNRPRQVGYDGPHAFVVRDPSFPPSTQAFDRPAIVAENRVTLLQNGVEILPAMLAAITAAEKTVNLEIYIFW